MSFCRYKCTRNLLNYIHISAPLTTIVICATESAAVIQTHGITFFTVCLQLYQKYSVQVSVFTDSGVNDDNKSSAMTPNLIPTAIKETIKTKAGKPSAKAETKDTSQRSTTVKTAKTETPQPATTVMSSSSNTSKVTAHTVITTSKTRTYTASRAFQPLSSSVALVNSAIFILFTLLLI